MGGTYSSEQSIYTTMIAWRVSKWPRGENKNQIDKVNKDAALLHAENWKGIAHRRGRLLQAVKVCKE